MFSSENVWTKVAYFNTNLHACLSKFSTIYTNHINKTVYVNAKADEYIHSETSDSV